MVEWLYDGNSLGNPISLGGFVQKTQGKNEIHGDPEADIILIEYLVTGVSIKTSPSHHYWYSIFPLYQDHKLIIDISRATEYGKHNYVFSINRFLGM